METISEYFNSIIFPHLGIFLKHVGDHISIGSFEIRFYGIIIMCGFILAYFLVTNEAKRTGQDPEMYLDFILILIIPVILGARIYYILFRLDQYIVAGNVKETILGMLNIRGGGLAIYGGVIAGIITGCIFAKRRKVNVLRLADTAAFGLLIGQILGRWGNFFNREAFGGMTELPWRMRLWISGTYYIDVHPTFLYESLWNVAGLLLLCLAVDKVRRFDGENTCFYFLWYGIGRFWIEGLRTDSLYLFHVTLFGERVRVSQALSLVMIVLTAVILLKNRSADPARMFVNRRLDGQATVLPDRSEERPIEDGPAEADRPAKTPAEDAAGGKASAEGAAEPADGGDNG